MPTRLDKTSRVLIRTIKEIVVDQRNSTSIKVNHIDGFIKVSNGWVKEFNPRKDDMVIVYTDSNNILTVGSLFRLKNSRYEIVEVTTPPSVERIPFLTRLRAIIIKIGRRLYYGPKAPNEQPKSDK